jgi:hypothetical protein
MARAQMQGANGDIGKLLLGGTGPGGGILVNRGSQERIRGQNRGWRTKWSALRGAGWCLVVVAGSISSGEDKALPSTGVLWGSGRRPGGCLCGELQHKARVWVEHPGMATLLDTRVQRWWPLWGVGDEPPPIVGVGAANSSMSSVGKKDGLGCALDFDALIGGSSISTPTSSTSGVDPTRYNVTNDGAHPDEVLASDSTALPRATSAWQTPLLAPTRSSAALFAP